ncbi:MAG: aminoacyl-tRNA hydrolase [Pseudomonadales bacterium]|nr:aminoacyl-tRNA hydrolase [Pseudomonadales bacterium]
MTVHVTDIPESEIEFTAVRSSGPGGQNVNKVSTAVQLRFDIHASSLPEDLKARLLRLRDHRVTEGGVVIIKAQTTRSQDKNRQDALDRLEDLLKRAQVTRKSRVRTRPSKSSVKKRLDTKTRRGDIKRKRKTPDDY